VRETPIRDLLVLVRRIVDDDWEKERPVGDHQVTAVDGELPLKAKIPFVARVRMARDDWDE